MNRQRVFIIVLAIILSKVALDAAFKIHYFKGEVYQIKNLELGNYKIPEGDIIVGKNIIGELEAAIIPKADLINTSNSKSIKSEYVYLRFHPDWFESKIFPFIYSADNNEYKELRWKMKEINDLHFRRYAHFNDYPLIKPGLVVCLIQTAEGKAILVSDE